MTFYIHQDPSWPRFMWKTERLAAPLAATRHQQGLLLGRMQALGFPQQSEAVLTALTQDVLKSSEIEGEMLGREQVRSSIARRLGLNQASLLPTDRHVEGVVEMMLDATQKYDKPLSRERLFGWHAALFPDGYSGMRKIRVGLWRDDAAGPMQVVSGPMGREHVHFEAPAAARLQEEMDSFLAWFNGAAETDLVMKAAIAHLWFITLHPFEDGNGRIARALTDMLLARSEKTPQRFYSLSAQIQKNRGAYYDILEQTQRGDLDVTSWIEWFLETFSKALEGTEALLGDVLRKARFWEKQAGQELNARQTAMLKKLLDGFEGNLTSSKWAKIAKCSQDTALRDIQDLLQKGILVKAEGGGRSTYYRVRSAA